MLHLYFTNTEVVVSVVRGMRSREAFRRNRYIIPLAGCTAFVQSALVYLLTTHPIHAG